MKEKSIINQIIKTTIFGIIIILLFAHVEIDLTIKKSKISFFESLIDASKNVYTAYKEVKKVF